MGKRPDTLPMRTLYANLLHTSPQSIVVINPDTSVRYVNPALERQTGFSSKEIVGLMAPYPWWPRHRPYWTQQTYREIVREANTCEILLQSRNRELFWAEVTDIPIRRRGELVYHISVWQDITTRKQMEQALRQSELTARAFMSVATESAMLLDVRGTILDVNQAGAKQFGGTTQEMIGRSLSDHLPSIPSQIRKVAGSGKASRFEGEYKGRILGCTICPVLNEHDRVEHLVLCASDITEEKRAQEELRLYHDRLCALAAALPLAEERERQRLASELHDGIGQNLAVSKIKLAQLFRTLANTDQSQCLLEVYHLIDQAIDYTRSLTFELSPPILFERGLSEAVEWLTEWAQENYGVMVHFEDDGRPKPMSEELKVNLFRSIRELLVNVGKHSQAQKAEVCLRRNDGQIEITVEDNSIGIEASKIIGVNLATCGYGLFSIRERLEYLGGSIRIESVPGQGTRIILSVPLSASE